MSASIGELQIHCPASIFDMAANQEEWILGVSKSQTDSDIYSARSWLLTAKTIFPQSFRLQIEEYHLELRKKNTEECARVLNEIYRDFSNEPQLWKEIELLIEATEKSNDDFRKEIFDHLPPITQQGMIIGSAESVVNVAHYCRLMLLLMNKFPETISKYGLAITEKLVETERRVAENNTVNYCRTLLVRKVLPVICRYGNVGVSHKHFYKWLQKATEFYACFFTASDDAERRESWTEMSKLLSWIAMRCEWSLDSNSSDNDSISDRMSFMRDLFRRSRTDVDGAVNRKQIFYSTIILLFEAASTYMLLLDPSIYEDNSSTDQPYIHICVVGDQGQPQTSPGMQGASKRTSDLREAYNVGKEAWNILHSIDSFEKDFNHLTRRWKCERWLWFQLFLVDLHNMDGNYKAALSRLNAVESKLQELCPRKEVISRIYCLLASTLYSLEKFQESCEYIFQLLSHLPYTYHPNSEQVTRLLPLGNPQNHDLLLGGAQPSLQSVVLSVEDLLPFWVHVFISSLESVMRSVEDDQVLGHLIILSQYDWPRWKSQSSRVLTRLVEKRSFKFDLFFQYVINIDILEEIAYIKNQETCKLNLKQNPTERAHVTRGVNREADEEFWSAMKRNAQRSRESAADLVHRYLSENREVILSCINIVEPR
uniref:Integrator complex subunit 10 n=1 Tax=Phallusia mammillata TaxID=59560 RepID=A0A6F9DFX7_9ASCI|nr:integrator complex subunit 10-like [Phallusia mammillata]